MLCWHSSWLQTWQKPVVVDAAVPHVRATPVAIPLQAVQLLAVQLLAAAADAVQLQAAQHQLAVAAAADAVQLLAVQHQLAAAAAVDAEAPSKWQLQHAAPVKVQLLQLRLQLTLQSHQLRSSFVPTGKTQRLVILWIASRFALVLLKSRREPSHLLESQDSRGENRPPATRLLLL